MPIDILPGKDYDTTWSLTKLGDEAVPLKIWNMMGFLGTIVFMVVLGVASGRKVKTSKDFQTGGKNAGFLLVAGTITGTLVGGSSTIGTAELAFHAGISAWWYTMGGAFGCLLLGLVYSIPVRESECTTIQEIIRWEYGETAGVVTSLLTSVGIVLNIVAQLLAANALLGSMLGFHTVLCGIIAVVLMGCYVLFGGIRSSGVLGVVKLILIYVGAVGGGVLVLWMAGGLPGLEAALPTRQYFNFLTQGAEKDLNNCLSVMLGVVSTQTYVQAVIMGKSNREAQKGCFLSALIMPPVGIFSSLIGMYMRVEAPGLTAGQAFPQFVIRFLPAFPAGIVLAALLFAVVGTASGMALGFGTIVCNDLYGRYLNPKADGRKMLLISRLMIAAVLAFAALFTLGNLGSAILTFGFLSMGLRAAVLLAPMTAALFLPGRVDRRFAVASSCAGICAMLYAELTAFPLNPLCAGMIASFACLTLGLRRHKVRDRRHRVMVEK